MNINIGIMNKAAVLVALYNSARSQGLGAIVAAGHKSEMTEENARSLLAEQTYFDYVNGRVMKVDLGGDELRTALYDRDNGQGAAEAALRDAGLLPAEPATGSASTDRKEGATDE